MISGMLLKCSLRVLEEISVSILEILKNNRLQKSKEAFMKQKGILLTVYKIKEKKVKKNNL